jgi:hypothetical protein
MSSPKNMSSQNQNQNQSQNNNSMSVPLSVAAEQNAENLPCEPLNTRVYRAICYACDRDGNCPSEYEKDLLSLSSNAPSPEIFRAISFITDKDGQCPSEYKQDFVNLCLNEDIFNSDYTYECLFPAAEELTGYA